MRFKMIVGISTIKRPKKGSNFIYSTSLYGFSNPEKRFGERDNITSIILYLIVFQIFRNIKPHNGCAILFLNEFIILSHDL